MYKVIFFDLGGVIVHDFFSGGDKLFAKNLNIPLEAARDAYVATDDPAYSKGLLSDKDRWRAFVEYVGLPASSVNRCIATYFETYTAIPETIQLLQSLHAQGSRYALGVISDQPAGVAAYLQRKFQPVFALFTDQLVLISAETGMSKRDLDGSLFREAIARAGRPVHELLYIDDSAKHVQEAAKVGLPGWHFDHINVPLAKLLAALEIKLGYTNPKMIGN